MHEITTHLFTVPIPLLEKIVRPIIVYVFLVLLLRVFGKRELAQLNPFDLVVLLSLSNTVQNAPSPCDAHHRRFSAGAEMTPI